MSIKNWIFRRIFADEYALQQKNYHEAVRSVAAVAEADHKIRNRDLEIRDLKVTLDALRPKPARFDRYRAMDDDQLAEVLSGAGALPQVKAIMELIDTKFQQAGDAARDAQLPDNETKFNLGGEHWMLMLKQELQAHLQQERKPEPKR